MEAKMTQLEQLVAMLDSSVTYYTRDDDDAETCITIPGGDTEETCFTFLHGTLVKVDVASWHYSD